MSAADVPFGPLTLHLPDESDPTFWFMHDLAGLLGLDFSSEAEARLRAALRAAKVRGIDLDHEADFVFVHAQTAPAMLAVLDVMTALAPSAFAGADLVSVETTIRHQKELDYP